MKMDFKLYAFLLLALFSLTACGGGSEGVSSGGVTTPVDPPPSDSGEVLSTGTYNKIGQTWSYQNLRLPNQTGGYAYAKYFQAEGAGPHPVIVITKPYAGINWTGEAVDTRWADDYNNYVAAGGVPPMCAPDVDSPDYDSKTSSTTCYSLTNSNKIGDEAFIYLWNN